jgi:gluconolactonase
VWDKDNGVLYFSEITKDSSPDVVPANVLRLIPSNNSVTQVFADPGTNGLALDAAGNLLACSFKERGILKLNRTTAEPPYDIVQNTNSSSQHFNSPNDITIRTDGTIYFTDPQFQLFGRTTETGVKAVYRIPPARNTVYPVDTTSFTGPNGIALSPDEQTLYVGDASKGKLYKLAVNADGSTGTPSDFYTTGTTTIASVDGVAVDCAGNTYWASNSGAKVVVLSAAGTLVGEFAVLKGVTNLAFGGSDMKTLYITADRTIFSLAMNVPGFPY